MQQAPSCEPLRRARSKSYGASVQTPSGPANCAKRFFFVQDEFEINVQMTGGGLLRSRWLLLLLRCGLFCFLAERVSRLSWRAGSGQLAAQRARLSVRLKSISLFFSFLYSAPLRGRRPHCARLISRLILSVSFCCSALCIDFLVF